MFLVLFESTTLAVKMNFVTFKMAEILQCECGIDELEVEGEAVEGVHVISMGIALMRCQSQG